MPVRNMRDYFFCKLPRKIITKNKSDVVYDFVQQHEASSNFYRQRKTEMFRLEECWRVIE